MSFIQVEIGSNQALKELTEALLSLQDDIPTVSILDELTALLLNRQRTRYRAATDPDGVPWLPSQAALDRAKSGRDGKTLFDSGTLYHSIQAHIIDFYSSDISTDVDYGKYHQYGMGQVLRQFLGFSQDDETIAEKFVTRRIADYLKEKGYGAS